MKQPIYKNSWRWTCKCPKHVETIYENKIIVKLFASSWYILVTRILNLIHFEVPATFIFIWSCISSTWTRICTVLIKTKWHKVTKKNTYYSSRDLLTYLDRASARIHQRERYLSDSGKCIPLFVAQTARHVEVTKRRTVIAQWLSLPISRLHDFQLYTTYISITKLHVTA